MDITPKQSGSTQHPHPVREVSVNVLEAQFKRAVRPKVRLWAMIRLAEKLVGKDATQSERALLLFAEAERLAESIRDRRGVAAAIHGNGNCQFFLFSFAAALETLERALPIAEQTGDADREILILRDMGQVYWRQSRHELALKTLTKCAELAELVGNHHMHASAFAQMGSMFTDIGRYLESIEYYTKGLSLLEYTGWTYNQMCALHNMNNPLRYLGRFEEALSILEQCRSIIPYGQDSRIEGVRQISLAGIYSDIGDYPSALSSLLASATILEQNGDKLNLPVTYENLMDLYLVFGNTEQAKSLGEKALALYDEIGDKSGHAIMFESLGRYHLNCGQRDEAMQFLKCGLTLSRKTGYKLCETIVLTSLAKLEIDLGNFTASEKFLLDALEIATLSGSPDLIVNALLGLGALSNKRNQPDTALPFLERAITIARETHLRPREQEAHQIVAEALEAKGDLGQALLHWKLASSIKEEMLGAEKQEAITAIQIRAAIEKSEKEKALLKKETKSKSQEIERIAMSLTEKNEVIRKIVKCRNRDERSQLNKLLSDLEHGYSIGDKRTALPNEFQLVHRDTLQKLSNRYPALSSTESKVCILLRDGLSTKQMADMLKVTPRAVEKHRYAIRKKMKLERETSLTTLMAGM